MSDELVIEQLQDYLRRFPSGHFAELAQLQLDRALAAQGEKRVEIAPQQGNPYTKGSARADTAYRVGDHYVLQVMDPYSRVVERTVKAVVIEITEDEVRFNGGRVTDLLGNVLRHPDGRRLTPNQTMPLELSVGRHWSTRFYVTPPNGGAPSLNQSDLRIAAREKITVPAGTFDAFRIESRGTVYFPKGVVHLDVDAWRVPEIRLPVARQEIRRRGPKVLGAERTELVSFHQA